MSTRDAGVKALKILGRHAEIIMDAYERRGGVLDDSPENTNKIDDLVKYRFATFDDESGGSPRLDSQVKSLLDQAVKSTKLRMSDVNIGEAMNDIVLYVREYKRAKSEDRAADCNSRLADVEENVLKLCDNLTRESENIWRQIDSDFGTSTILRTKMELNRNAMGKITRILEALDLIDIDQLYNFGHTDTHLRRLLSVRLPRVINTCRTELSDAIHRLNKMMFQLNKLAKHANMVNSVLNQYEVNPGFKPEDYTDRTEVPALFMCVKPIGKQVGKQVVLTGLVDVDSSTLEPVFSELIEGLRKELPPNEKQLAQPVPVAEGEQTLQVLEQGPFKRAIRDMFYECLSEGKEISVIDGFKRAPEGSDLHLWAYALLAEFNSMRDEERELFSLKYEGKPHEVFTGNFIAKDVVLCPS